ncbi:hypothetical protein DEVEQU_00649 [Devosia equisanguinis]|uniref:DUF3137 domain-containing protein n=1 Tax=Devosia equisanguinis TaxID=2490941 RepID=A0A3S5D377_9HYPH|nr:DUF3137 domain-containing protein [Devosia equisanguinis]VDS03526.1 hypothetical protein DEVEQU_00649 [Devosia equisanguinis]
MSQPTAAPLASGVERGTVDAILTAAEPRRLHTLSSALNLSLATFLTLGAGPALDGSLVWPIAAAMVAVALWQLSQRLWRDLAIAVLAPAIGGRWGQADFSAGWGAVDVERWFADLFSPEGARFTAWRSQGRYHDVDYRLSEMTIWRKRVSNRPRQLDYVMSVEVAVPQAFSGRVDLVPRSGFAGRIDDLIRQVSGTTAQRLEVDPVFDRVFDTIANQSASAETLLTPAFRQAMLTLAARHPGLYLTARFEHGWFSLRLPIPHLVFARASLLRPLTEMAEDADALWWDLTVPHRLIEALMGERDGPLR